MIVTAVARGTTRVLRVPARASFAALLNRVPSFGEKLIVAFTRRRKLLTQSGVLGLRVVGPGRCRDTNTVREFLYKNFVPFTWFDPETEEGQTVLEALGSPRKTPVIECGDGRVLVNPTLQELASEAGIWRHCPSQEVDFAIVGAGPAGIAAAVYAASEGLVDVDARSARAGRAGGRFVADRKLHRLSGRIERRGAGHARRVADAQVRRTDRRPGRGRKADSREVGRMTCTC